MAPDSTNTIEAHERIFVLSACNIQLDVCLPLPRLICDPDIVCINIDFQEADTNIKYHQPIVNARPSRIQILLTLISYHR